jgi:ubiquitin carboxyl-terminal hydrolase 7
LNLKRNRIWDGKPVTFYLLTLRHLTVLFSPEDPSADGTITLKPIPLPDAPWDWHVCVQLALVVWNPSNPAEFAWRGISQRFEAHPETQYDTFSYRNPDIRWADDSTITSPGVGSGVNVTVYLRRVSDRSGRLWRAVKDYDHRWQRSYVGIANQGMTGYMQFTLLTLFHVGALHKVIRSFSS